MLSGHGEKVFAFVDADNFRLGLMSKFRALGIPDEAANLFDMLNLFRQFYQVTRFYLYNSVPLGEEPAQWIKSLRAEPRFVFRGTLLRDTGKQRKQEGVDVRLAVEAVQAAHRKTMSSCVIFSDDGDLIPLVNALVDEGMSTTVATFGNPEKSEVAARLRDASDHFIQIGHSILWNSHVTSKQEYLNWIDHRTDTPPPHQLVVDEEFGDGVRIRKVGNEEIELYDTEKGSRFRAFESRESALLWYKLTGSVRGNDANKFPVEDCSTDQNEIVPTVIRH